MTAFADSLQPKPHATFRDTKFGKNLADNFFGKVFDAVKNEVVTSGKSAAGDLLKKTADSVTPGLLEKVQSTCNEGAKMALKDYWPRVIIGVSAFAALNIAAGFLIGRSKKTKNS